MKKIGLFKQSEKHPGELDPWSVLLPVTFDLVCGILLILLGNLALRVTAYALSGLLIICSGWLLLTYIRSELMEKITGFKLAGALALFASGVLLAFSPDYLKEFLPFVWALALLFGAFVKVQYAFDEKLLNIEKWWIMLIFAAVSMVLGVLCLASPDFFGNNRAVIIGVLLVVEAVLDLVVFIMTNKALKQKLPTALEVYSPVRPGTAAEPAASAEPSSPADDFRPDA